MTPCGCWNCKHASMPEDQTRPKEFKPGLEYKAACDHPDAPHIVCSMTMIEENPSYPICERFQTI